MLVNNVGMAKGAGLVDTPDAAWQEALDYTLYPAVRASRAAVPHMIRRGGGSIVLIASIYGREAGGRLTYNVVKAAEISLGKALARELAPKNIRVNTIAPGSILFPGGSWHQRQQADPAGIADFVPASCRSAASAGPRKSATRWPGWPRRARAGSAAPASRSTAARAGRTSERAMNELMAAASSWIEAAADALFMPWIVVLLFGAGLFLTVRYRFAQFRCSRTPCAPALRRRIARRRAAR